MEYCTLTICKMVEVRVKLAHVHDNITSIQCEKVFGKSKLIKNFPWFLTGRAVFLFLLLPVVVVMLLPLLLPYLFLSFFCFTLTWCGQSFRLLTSNIQGNTPKRTECNVV